MRKIAYLLLAIILLIMFLNFDLNSFIDSVTQVPPLAFVGLLLIQIISQLLVNYQWCRVGKIMGGAHDFFKMLYVNAKGAIMDSITPGVKVGGEVTRALLLKSVLNYSTKEAATLVTIQKIMSFSSFFLINIFAITHLSREVNFLQKVTVKASIYFFLVTIVGLFIYIFTATNYLKKWATSKTPKHKWSIALHGYLLTLLENINILKNIKGEILKQLLLSFSIWILFPLKMILLVNLFSPNYDPIFLTEVTFISYMMGMIPLLPGGIGSFETTMTGLLMIMEIQAEEALAITFLFRFITFWFVIILSLIYAGVWKIGEKKYEN